MKDKIKCIIIENELPASQIIEHYISDIGIFNLVGVFISATQALATIAKEKPELIFLDIELPTISGVDFIKSLRPAPSVIFTTAYSDYAVQSFELEAIDYLLKPISLNRFIKAVNRYLRLKELSLLPLQNEPSIKERSFIFIRSDRKMEKIFHDEILYFEAQKNYVDIYTEHKKYTTYHSITEMEEKLPEKIFMRIHRSFIVAAAKVESYTSDFMMIKEKMIPIGRQYKATTLFELLKLPRL